MTEAELETTVVDAGRWLGYHVHAQRPARRADGSYHVAIKGDAGWPDVVLVGYGVAFVLELKASKGRLRPGQQEWIDRWAQVPGVHAQVLRPDGLDGLLAELQAARARPH